MQVAQDDQELFHTFYNLDNELPVAPYQLSPTRFYVICVSVVGEYSDPGIDIPPIIVYKAILTSEYKAKSGIYRVIKKFHFYSKIILLRKGNPSLNCFILFVLFLTLIEIFGLVCLNISSLGDLKQYYEICW